MQFHGPLRVIARNPRYFADDRDQAIYLTGSHTWANLVDIRFEEDPCFDYTEYLDFMQANNHNFMRMWSWHHGPGGNPWTTRESIVDPVPYLRTGPATAADGGPRFDLSQPNPVYFDRLRQRVVAAGERGIYVSVMLYEGSLIMQRAGNFPGDCWKYHPYNVHNNINHIDGDPDKAGRADIFTLQRPAILALQELYVRWVVDAVNDLDNVLYEIANELGFEKGGLDWQCHMLEFIREYEQGKPRQHLIGITGGGYGKPDNAALFACPADWISPWSGPEDEYKYNPPPADGSKVIISDTDHIWGIGGNYKWVWKSFLRGLNPIFMDPWEPILGEPSPWARFNTRDYVDWELLRANMGHTRRFAERLNLNVMLPHGELASSRYCLADPGNTYLVYVPEDALVFVDLTAVAGELAVEWFNPKTGASITDARIQGGKRSQRFTSPLGMDVVLYLSFRK